MNWSLSTRSTQSLLWGKSIEHVLAASLDAVEPGAALKRFLTLQDNFIEIGEQQYPLNEIQRILVVGAGKAGAAMARATHEILGTWITDGVVVVKEGYARAEGVSSITAVGPIQIISGSHPIPDQRSLAGAARIRNLLQNTSANDLVICLVSGGGSALIVSPAQGITISDLQQLTTQLLACGANIHEINILRKHLDQIKGGGLARMAAPAPLTALILSDVVGDPLDIIASGPTVPDPSTYLDAYQILERYHILERVPPAIVTHLQDGIQDKLPETPKPGNPLFSRVHNMIIGCNNQAARAALEQAQHEDLNTLLLTTHLQGEARQAGRMLAAILRQVALRGEPISIPACLVAGGETTVTIQGQGLGGRNQELALSAVYDLAGLPNVAMVAMATDGGDGPTDAAGAMITGETLARARQLDMEPSDYLDRNDSYHFFEKLGDLIRPGPTQTNVNDLAFLFAF
jgi:glycerate 2-kinase